jgi:hypothetical protein
MSECRYVVPCSQCVSAGRFLKLLLHVTRHLCAHVAWTFVALGCGVMSLNAVLGRKKREGGVYQETVHVEKHVRQYPLEEGVRSARSGRNVCSVLENCLLLR